MDTEEKLAQAERLLSEVATELDEGKETGDKDNMSQDAQSIDSHIQVIIGALQ